MKHTIENHHLKIEVKQVGAELCSMLSKKTGREYIWQADPKVWAGASPILFPIIGGLKGGQYLHQDKQYQLPKHGFLQENPAVSLACQTHSTLSFSLCANEETLAAYPFFFEITITFTLADYRLEVAHQVTNVGKAAMYFSLGGHPAFQVPFAEGGLYDYYLAFEQREHNSIFEISPNGLLTHKQTRCMENTHCLPWSKDTFQNDALVFAQLRSSKVSLRARQHQDHISVRFDDFPYLAIWSKPNAHFICIEPWHGLPDFEEGNGVLVDKTGIIKLLPHHTHHCAYTIEVHEDGKS